LGHSSCPGPRSITATRCWIPTRCRISKMARLLRALFFCTNSQPITAETGTQTRWISEERNGHGPPLGNRTGLDGVMKPDSPLPENVFRPPPPLTRMSRNVPGLLAWRSGKDRSRNPRRAGPKGGRRSVPSRGQLENGSWGFLRPKLRRVSPECGFTCAGGCWDETLSILDRLSRKQRLNQGRWNSSTVSARRCTH
jgi:hypothetical protein